MKFLLLPDSFKGTLSAIRVCRAMEAGIREVLPESETVSLPLADGGEGTVDAFLAALGGQRKTVSVCGPRMERIPADFALLPDGKTAVIEIASCAGLPLVGEQKDPLAATTFGVGQLILAAIECGATHIYLGLGGSATNDGGCGAACACGITFTDSTGNSFLPTGGTLHRIEQISFSKKDPRLAGISFTLLCDIDNPLCGKNGAAYVYAPQKGALPEQLPLLDSGLSHLAEKLARFTGKEISNLPGSGAAGGMGGGMYAFFGAEMQSGVQTMLDLIRFERVAADSDWIFTGEGCLDRQSLRGKAVIGVARRAKPLQKPVVAFVGGIRDDEISEAFSQGLTAAFPISRLPQPLSESAPRSAANLQASVAQAVRLLALSEFR